MISWHPCNEYRSYHENMFASLFRIRIVLIENNVSMDHWHTKRVRKFSFVDICSQILTESLHTETCNMKFCAEFM